MTETEFTLDDPEAVDGPRPRAFRLTIWAMLILCGGLMVVVALSDPRIAAQVQTATAPLDAQLQRLWPGTSDGAPTAGHIARPVPVETTSANPGDDRADRPVIRAMPSDRTPVRRAGISAGN